MAQKMNKKQQQLVIGLSIIAVILVVIVVVLVATKPKATTATAPTTTTQGQTADASAMPSGVADQFDAAKATKVPKETTPVKFVEDYYKAVVAGEYEKAYGYLPEAKRANTTLEAYEKQLTGYGINGYTTPVEETQTDTDMQITAGEKCGNYGTFTTIWSFTKGSDGAWLLKDKVVAGMQ